MQLRPAAARSSSERRHRMSGSRRSVPKPRAGRVEQDAIEHRRRTAARPPRSPGRRARTAPGRLNGPREQIDAPPADVGRDDQPAVLHGRRHRGGLAARRGAGVEHPLARRRGRQQRDELRGFVLDEEQPAGGERGQQRDCRCATIRPCGANRVGSVSTPCVCERCGQRVARDPQRVGAQRQRGGAVVEPRPRFGRLEPVAIEPSRRPATRGCDSVVARYASAAARSAAPSGRGGSGRCARSRLMRRRTALTRPDALLLARFAREIRRRR